MDATLVLSKGVHKTLLNCSREVAKVADELCEFSDIDDIFKLVDDHSEKGMSANNLSDLASSNKEKFINILILDACISSKRTSCYKYHLTCSHNHIIFTTTKHAREFGLYFGTIVETKSIIIISPKI